MRELQRGFELVFMAPQSRRHRGKGVIDTVIEQAHALGITRMTKRIAAEGAGSNGQVHSAHFFELADQPIELAYVLDVDLADRLIDAVDRQGIHVFCLRRPVDYADLGRKEC